MALLTESQLQQVAAAISDVEQKTDAELVCVLAPRADDYRYIPLLWAAGIALTVPGIAELLNLWWSHMGIWLLQLAVFVVLAVVLRWPPLLCRLIPRSVREWRAGNLARRQFLEQNLHRTTGGNGVLIFVSEAEHHVEILADAGVAEVVNNTEWADIISNFTRQVRAGETLTGFLESIKSCGELLAERRPATHEKNELPNHLVILEGG